MQNYLPKIPLLLFAVYTIKLLVTPSWSYESALVLFVLAGLSALFEYNMRSSEVKNLYKALDENKKEIAAIRQHQERLNDSVSSIKLSNNIKTQGNQPLRF